MKTTQPVKCTGFSRGKRGYLCIINNLIMCYNTNRPARIARRNSTVIVYTIGKEFFFTAGNPISSVTVLDPECLIEPSFTHENTDKFLQDVYRLLFFRILQKSITSLQVSPTGIFMIRLPVLCLPHGSADKDFLTSCPLNVKGYLETSVSTLMYIMVVYGDIRSYNNLF